MNLRPSGLGHSIYQGDHIIEVKGKRIPQNVHLNQLGSFLLPAPAILSFAHLSPEVAPNDRNGHILDVGTLVVSGISFCNSLGSKLARFRTLRQAKASVTVPSVICGVRILSDSYVVLILDHLVRDVCFLLVCMTTYSI